MSIKDLIPLTSIAAGMIIAIGLYLQLSQEASGGYIIGRTGGVSSGSINGFSCYFIGTLLFLLSILFYISSKKEQKKKDSAAKTAKRKKRTENK